MQILSRDIEVKVKIIITFYELYLIFILLKPSQPADVNWKTTSSLFTVNLS